jgi:hypothetical protein
VANDVYGHRTADYPLSSHRGLVRWVIDNPVETVYHRLFLTYSETALYFISMGLVNRQITLNKGGTKMTNLLLNPDFGHEDFNFGDWVADLASEGKAPCVHCYKVIDMDGAPEPVTGGYECDYCFLFSL